ncbi:MAG: prolyl oligopeptidase family serine peptidase [bacterium]
MKKLILFIVCIIIANNLSAQESSFVYEQYDWLEDFTNQKTQDWVNDQNQKSFAYFDSLELLPKIEKWYNSYKKDKEWETVTRIPPAADQIGKYAELAQGNHWRRMLMEDFLVGKMNPELNITIDDLNLSEGTTWQFDKIISQPEKHNRAIVFYKKQGHRNLKGILEFDTAEKEIVKDGFNLDPNTTQLQWRDENSVYICTNLDFIYEHGNKLRIWNRGEPIEKARILFQSDLYKVRVKLIECNQHLFVLEEKQAFDINYFYLKNDQLTPLNLPNDLKDFKIVSDQLVVHLKSAWTLNEKVYPSGSLISIDFESFLDGNSDFKLIAESTKELVIDQIWNTDDVLIARALKDVNASLIEWSFSNGKWQSVSLDEPKGGNIQVYRIQSPSNRYYIYQDGFLEQGMYARNSDGTITKGMESIEPIERDSIQVNQWFATSKDGTKVPYFVIHKKSLNLDNNNPVIMTGYGGWGTSLLPSSLKQYNKWVNDGGVYVLVNIRGGGEYGPEWHYGARKSKRQNAYDDFKAIAEDLITRKVTRKGIIGAHGGSNGGLLVANAFIQNPALFGAIVMRSGSINLQKGGAATGTGIGATGERGDQDIPEDWAYMKKISPLHNLKSNENYPPVLLFDSRNDDISTPSTSRKFTKRMNDLGYSDVYLLETEGGGHTYTDLSNQQDMELAFFYKNIHPNYDAILLQKEDSSYYIYIIGLIAVLLLLFVIKKVKK